MAKRATRRVDDDEHEQEPASKGVGVEITYRPIDTGDPFKIDWDGLLFEANVPRVVKRKDIIAMAKNNPWFEVAGHPRAKRVKPTAEPVPPAGQDVDPIALDDNKMVEEE